METEKSPDKPVTWLIRHVKEDPSAFIGRKELHKHCQFIPGNKLSYYVTKLFPQSTKYRKHFKGKQIEGYKGVTFIANAIPDDRKRCSIEELEQLLPRDVIKVRSSENLLIIAMVSDLFVNDSIIIKQIEFDIQSNIWNMRVSGKMVDLSYFGVDNCFISTKTEFMNVLSIARRMYLCCGHPGSGDGKLKNDYTFTEKVKSERINNYACDQTMIRSVYCKKIVHWGSRLNLSCEICISKVGMTKNKTCGAITKSPLV